MAKIAHLGQDRIGKEKGRNDRISSCKFTVWENLSLSLSRDRMGKFAPYWLPIRVVFVSSALPFRSVTDEEISAYKESHLVMLATGIFTHDCDSMDTGLTQGTSTFYTSWDDNRCMAATVVETDTQQSNEPEIHLEIST